MRMSGLVWCALIVLWPLQAARADAIDGDWCRGAGRQFSIRGSDIVTPGGAHRRGTYGRHSFAYVVPAPEPGAGRTVFMTLVNEQTVYLRLDDVPISATDSAVEVWRRCTPATSAVERGKAVPLSRFRSDSAG